MGQCQCQKNQRHLGLAWPTNRQRATLTLKSFKTLRTIETTASGDLLRASQRCFDRFDKDQDKKLNKDELKSFLKYANKKQFNKEKTSWQLDIEVQTFLQKIGKNNKQFITRHEFIQHLSQIQDQII